MTWVDSCFHLLVIDLAGLGEADHGRAKLPTLFRLGRKEREREGNGGRERRERGGELIT